MREIRKLNENWSVEVRTSRLINDKFLTAKLIHHERYVSINRRFLLPNKRETRYKDEQKLSVSTTFVDDDSNQNKRVDANDVQNILDKLKTSMNQKIEKHIAEQEQAETFEKAVDEAVNETELPISKYEEVVL